SFREDLYYRVGAFPIRLPPLRDRRDDIPLLADRFLARAAERHRKRIPGMEPAVLALLVQFGWPGNVRELENEVERAVALARDGEPIGAAHLSPKLGAAGAAPCASTGATSGAAAAALRRAHTRAARAGGRAGPPADRQPRRRPLSCGGAGRGVLPRHPRRGPDRRADPAR